MQPDALVAVLELEASASVALLAAGYPPDLTRPPTPVEVASRTNYLQVERETEKTAAAMAQLALEARARALRLVLQSVAGSSSVSEWLARIDALAGGRSTLDGSAALIADVQARGYARLVQGAETAMARFRTDQARAGIRAAGTESGLSAGTRVALDDQARRLATDAVATAIRAARGAGYATTRLDRPVADFHADVSAAAVDVGTKGLEDVALQTAHRAHGGGRMDAVSQVPIGTATLYASELLDRRTCHPCSDIDGTAMTEAEAAVMYPLGQYVECEGGWRCRGTVIAVAEGESPSLLQVPGDGGASDGEGD